MAENILKIEAMELSWGDLIRTDKIPTTRKESDRSVLQQG